MFNAGIQHTITVLKQIQKGALTLDQGAAELKMSTEELIELLKNTNF